MPASILKRGSRIQIDKGSRVASAKVTLEMVVAKSSMLQSIMVAIRVRDAFRAACAEFEAEFGRVPKWDELRFRGGITTFDIIFEICEDPDDEDQIRVPRR